MMCHHPDHTTSSSSSSPLCYGVLKIFRSKVVYEHTKRCLTLLQNEDFVPRLLYSNDTTLTIVEEDRGQLTMMNAPIPMDFDQQIHRMICRLRQYYRIIHRDITYTNFVIDPKTGFISLIDFGDAFVAIDEETEVGLLTGTNLMANAKSGPADNNSNNNIILRIEPPPTKRVRYSSSSPSSLLCWWSNRSNWNGRNMVNLFNIWLYSYDEEARVSQFIQDTIPHIHGTRQWRPPPQRLDINTIDELKTVSLLLKQKLKGG